MSGAASIIYHDFLSDRGFSHAHEWFWAEAYSELFGLHGRFWLRSTGIENEEQDAGIDRVITFWDGTAIFVEEKLRTRDYNDIFIEITSSTFSDTPGWIEKELACDYVAYGFLPSLRVYLFPWGELKAAWKKYGDIWTTRYGTRSVPNITYDTLGVPVPIRTITQAVPGHRFIVLNRRAVEQRKRQNGRRALTADQKLL